MTPHVSNDEKLAQLAREKNDLAARRARAWVCIDVALNHRANDARIGGTEEIENVIGKAHEAGYVLYKLESFELPAFNGVGRKYMMLVFHTCELVV